MDYRLVHDAIIGRARLRVKPDVYCERHHVVMKSMGGTNAKVNLVWLTAREHYIVHWLLFKIHRNQETAFAWFRMTHGRKAVGRYTSHTFAYAKLARVGFVSQLFKGRKISAEHREKLRAAKQGRTYADLGRSPESPLRGRPVSPEHRARSAKAARGRKMSDEARQKISASKMGPLNPRFGKPAHNAKPKAPKGPRKVPPPRGQLYLFNGEHLGTVEIARRLGINHGTFFGRLKSGWTIEQASRPARPMRRKELEKQE